MWDIDGWLAWPLAHGAELARTTFASPGTSVVRRDGRVVLELGSAMANQWWVSHDRDLVTLDSSNATVNRVLDLRQGIVGELPEGCWVADRHGATQYRVCEEAGSTYLLASEESDPSPRVLAGDTEPGAAGRWTKAMASPDGARLLLQWSADGRAVVSVREPAIALPFFVRMTPDTASSAQRTKESATQQSQRRWMVSGSRLMTRVFSM